MRDIESSTELDEAWDVWQAAGYGGRIDYPRAVMDELGLAATEGFNRLLRGGVEIGGVLFGLREPDAVKILTHRALACEYAFGPSFTLSDNDRRAFEALLDSPRTDHELSGIQPVGWYHSHTRSEILLSEKDLELFQSYFPESWQIALVLRPHRFDPVRAGFFFREADGSVHAVSSRQEFVIQAGAVKPAILVPGAREPNAVPALAPPAHHEIPAPALSEPIPPPAPISPEPRREPRPRQVARPRADTRYSRRRWAWIAAMAGVLAGGLFWIGSSLSSTGVSLHALDLGGQLRIDWNCNPRVLQQSDGGELEIEDGSQKVLNVLSPGQLRAGSLTYARTTGNVLVRLTVHATDQSTLTQTAQFLGTPVAIAAPTATASNEWPTEKVSAVNAPAAPEPGGEARRQELVAQLPNRMPAEERVKTKGESARQAPAVSAPAPRKLVLPAASIPSPAETLVPTPPAIAANTAPPMTTLVPRLPAPVPVRLQTADPGPAAGKIIWTGRLTRRGTVQILGTRASRGNITGGLPGVPVRVRVYPAELTQEGLRVFTADPKSITAPEAAGSQNGWNRTVYVLNPRQAGDISIVEAPGPQNAWNRLTLRAERNDHSIIVLRWEWLPVTASQ